MFLATLLVISCSDKADNPTSPNYTTTEDDYADASEDAGSAVADPDEGFLSMFEANAENSMQPGESKGGNGFQVADTSYSHNGLLFTWDKTYYDADSNASEAYSSETTVRVFSGMSVVGTIVRPRRTAEIDQSGYVNITGVTPGDAVLSINGSIRRSVSSEFQAGWRGVRKEFSGTHTWTIVNLQLGRNRLLFPYPLGGEIRGTADFTRIQVTPGRTKTVTVSMEYTVSFDGSRYGRMRFLSGMEFWVDLASGECHKDDPDDE